MRNGLWGLVLVGFAAVACRGEQAQPVPSQEELRAAIRQVAETAKAKVDAEYAAKQAAPAPRVVHGISDAAPAGLVSLVTFYNDDLDECADVMFEPIANGGAKETTAFAEQFSAYYASTRADFVQVPKLCDEQFAGRTVLATCTVQRATEGAKMSAAFRYYESYTLEHHDAHLRDCLKLGGEWRVGGDALAKR